MNRSNQPPELDFGDDELNAFESILSARTIIKQQENSGDDLNAKQEHRHAAEVVPDRMTMERNFLFVGQMRERANRQTLVKPGFGVFYLHRGSKDHLRFEI